MTEITEMIKAIANDSKVRIDRIVANYEQLEKENTELKKKILSYKDAVDMQMYTNKANKEIANRKLNEAKELLAQWVELFKPKGGNIPPTPIQIATEQFLNGEVEK